VCEKTLCDIVRPVAIVDDKHFVNCARLRAQSDPSGYYVNQFENEANWKTHFDTTGPEIWRQTAGTVDAFVMGSGTGGTLGGVSRFLKSQRASVRVFLADPFGSGLFNRVQHGVCFNQSTQREGTRKRHQTDSIVEGIGLTRITANFLAAESFIDGAFQCSDQEVVDMSRYILREEGFLVGSSTAVNLVGAVRAARQLGSGHTIVTILCDGGHRYLSTLWSDPFLAQRGLSPSNMEGLSFLDPDLKPRER